jgi:pimeloyl-ACP methyl ester carboxylesterase
MSQVVRSERMQLRIDSKLIEVAHLTLPGADDTILLLHEALGSIDYWKDFPERLAVATGSNVLVYSRAGHGHSEGPLEVRTTHSYLHHVNAVIPQLLDRFAIPDPVVYGHSEGACIALLFAAESRSVKAVIAESPFLVAHSAAAYLTAQMDKAYAGSKLQQRLAQYHREPDAVFRSWIDWTQTLTDGEFALRPALPKISCPLLVVQGADDPFGADIHLRVIRSALPHAQHNTLPATGHMPHREQTALVLDHVSQFLAGVRNQPDHGVPLSSASPEERKIV